jgi:hypothetical protein
MRVDDAGDAAGGYSARRSGASGASDPLRSFAVSQVKSAEISARLSASLASGRAGGRQGGGKAKGKGKGNSGNPLARLR